jgi:excisionase family DNA binding protein
MLGTKEAAEKIGVHKETLRRWRDSGRGPAYQKIGSRFYYKDGDIKKWLDSNRKDPEGSTDG